MSANFLIVLNGTQFPNSSGYNYRILVGKFPPSGESLATFTDHAVTAREASMGSLAIDLDRSSNLDGYLTVLAQSASSSRANLNAITTDLFCFNTFYGPFDFPGNSPLSTTRGFDAYSWVALARGPVGEEALIGLGGFFLGWSYMIVDAPSTTESTTTVNGATVLRVDNNVWVLYVSPNGRALRIAWIDTATLLAWRATTPPPPPVTPSWYWHGVHFTDSFINMTSAPAAVWDFNRGQVYIAANFDDGTYKVGIVSTNGSSGVPDSWPSQTITCGPASQVVPAIVLDGNILYICVHTADDVLAIDAIDMSVTSPTVNHLGTVQAQPPPAPSGAGSSSSSPSPVTLWPGIAGSIATMSVPYFWPGTHFDN